MALFCLHSQTLLSIIETLASYTVSVQRVLLHFRVNASEYLRRYVCTGWEKGVLCRKWHARLPPVISHHQTGVDIRLIVSCHIMIYFCSDKLQNQNIKFNSSNSCRGSSYLQTNPFPYCCKVYCYITLATLCVMLHFTLLQHKRTNEPWVIFRVVIRKTWLRSVTWNVVCLMRGHESDDHQPDTRIFVRGREKKPLSFTLTTQHFHLSVSLSLKLTCQISRSFSLTGSPTHNCVFSQRRQRECEPQASRECVLCVFCAPPEQSIDAVGANTK